VRRPLGALLDVLVTPRTASHITTEVTLSRNCQSLNAHAERFVLTIKESCLERMVLFGEAPLRTAIHNFAVHYLTERNHQGLGNRIINPEPGHLGNSGGVQRRQRLGGMLNY
jgi:putative transposase